MSDMNAALARLAQTNGGSPDPGLRPLLLAAHQDDETIGASALLGRLPGFTVVYLTDGAPHDPRLRSPHVSGSREFYAKVRAEEAAAALALVRIPTSSIILLGGTDQEAIHQLEGLLQGFTAVLREIRPAFVITHPYEGGHPDHDTAALIARLAMREMRANAPHLLEMTSYHARNGELVTGEFLLGQIHSASHDCESLTINLTSEARDKKIRMLACYRSQADVLSGLALEPERIRVAPDYDFTQPPHEGALWYERLGWPTSGAQWRELAAQTLSRLSEPTCH